MFKTRHLRIAAEGTQVLAGQGFAMVGQLVLIRTLSQQLDPTAFGTMALGLTGALLVNQTISGGTTGAISRHFTPAREAISIPAYLRASLRLLCRDQLWIGCGSLITALLLVLFGHFAWAALALCAAFVAMANSCSMAMAAVLTGGRHRLLPSAMAALDPWLKVFLLLLGWHWFRPTPIQTLLVYGLSSFLLTLAFVPLVQRMLGLLADSSRHADDADVVQWFCKMRRYGRPFARYGLFTWLQQASDRWALQTFSGSLAVGQYAIIYQLGYSSLGMLSNVMNTFVAPVLYGRAGDASNPERNQSAYRILQKLTLFGLAVSILLFGASSWLHRWIFALLVAPDYRGLSPYFPWMVLAGALFSVGQLVSLRFTSDNRTVELGGIKIVTAIVGLIFNIVGARIAGITGVLVAMNCFSVVYLCAMIRFGLFSASRHSSYLRNQH